MTVTRLTAVTGSRVVVFAVGSAYAWDVVESVRRSGLEPVCIDNLGGADPRLPLDSGHHESEPFILGLASAPGRAEAAAAALRSGYGEPRSLVDPTAVVASTATVGHGAYVNAGAVVGSNARIGCHVNVNRSASIGHDCVLDFAVSIGPGAVLAGSARIGPRAFVGAGATILPGISVGRRAIVGAGAVVTKDVADGDIVVGNPASVLRHVDLETKEDRCPHCSTP